MTVKSRGRFPPHEKRRRLFFRKSKTPQQADGASKWYYSFILSISVRLTPATLSNALWVTYSSLRSAYVSAAFSFLANSIRLLAIVTMQVYHEQSVKSMELSTKVYPEGESCYWMWMAAETNLPKEYFIQVFTSAKKQCMIKAVIKQRWKSQSEDGQPRRCGDIFGFCVFG